MRGYAALAFLTLFPFGPNGDPTVMGRKVDVDLRDALKHLCRYGVKKEDGSVSHPFNEHRRFIFWALNTLQRKQLLENSNFYFKQNPMDASMTIDQMQAIAQNEVAAAQLYTRFKSATKTVMGSAAFWGNKGKQLEALVEQKGDPTIFYTMSIADNHFPEFHRLEANHSCPALVKCLCLCC